MKRIALVLAAAAFLAATADAVPRSRAVRADFVRSHPCPATGKGHGACPGYVVDHVVPLCAGGPDATSNLQWQMTADGLAKDRIEGRQCSALRGRP